MELASLGRFTTYPNPRVGCVIVKDGVIVGEGYHHKAGCPHAEVMALNSAQGVDLTGATCYVTLEPCSHYGRTPPCALALVNHHVSRVVIATVDSNPKVAGRGIKILEDANIKVDVGILEEEARKLNEVFFTAIGRAYPFVTAKLGMSLDAKIALFNKESKWITNEKSRSMVQSLRAQSDIIITSARTVIDDNPRMNVRIDEMCAKDRAVILKEDFKTPIKVIIDSKGLLLDKYDDFSIFSTPSYHMIASEDVQSFADIKEQEITDNVTLIALPFNNGHVDLKVMLEYLGKKEFRHAFIEAGSTLISAFINQGLVDELYTFIGAKLLGVEAKDAFLLPKIASLKNVTKLSLKSYNILGDDIALCYKLIK